MPKTEDDVAPQPRRGRPRDPERLPAHHGSGAQPLRCARFRAGQRRRHRRRRRRLEDDHLQPLRFEGRTVRGGGSRSHRSRDGRAGRRRSAGPEAAPKALLAIGEQFLTLAREEDTLGQFRSIYGAAGTQREACRAFYRQGADRLIGDLAAYLRRADAQGTLNIRHPRQAADLFLSMFLGDGHIRGLMMLDMPDARENRALLREAVRVFMAAYAKAP